MLRGARNNRVLSAPGGCPPTLSLIISADIHMRRQLLFSLTLIGLCSGSFAAPLASAHDVHLTTKQIIARVGATYGDRKPRVVHVERTNTEGAPPQVMYLVQIAGTFHRGRVSARYLSFSALASRWYVWDVVGYDSHHHRRWSDATLPKHG